MEELEVLESIYLDDIKVEKDERYVKREKWHDTVLNSVFTLTHLPERLGQVKMDSDKWKLWKICLNK
jgi:hypothetical protein